MLAYWLKNSNSAATESHLQKAIEDAEFEGFTNSLPASRNKWLKIPGHYLIAIILPIILGVTMYTTCIATLP
jgi:hypothetical protein